MVRKNGQGHSHGEYRVHYLFLLGVRHTISQGSGINIELDQNYFASRGHYHHIILQFLANLLYLEVRSPQNQTQHEKTAKNKRFHLLLNSENL